LRIADCKLPIAPNAWQQRKGWRFLAIPKLEICNLQSEMVSPVRFVRQGHFFQAKSWKKRRTHEDSGDREAAVGLWWPGHRSGCWRSRSCERKRAARGRSPPMADCARPRRACRRSPRQGASCRQVSAALPLLRRSPPGWVFSDRISKNCREYSGRPGHQRVESVPQLTVGR